MDASVIAWLAEASDTEVVEALFCAGAPRAARIAAMTLKRVHEEASPILADIVERVEQDPRGVLFGALSGAIDAAAGRRRGR